MYTNLSNTRIRVFLTAILISGLYFGVVGLKFYHWPKMVFYTSDPAFRLRWVRMFAAGEGVPAWDKAAQWPEGLVAARADFLLEDAVIGRGFRLLSPLLGDSVTPDAYLRMFICFWSSLSLVVVYLWGRRLGDWLGGLLAAAFYGAGLPIYIRTCGNYLREDFVLPFYFFALYAQARTLEGGRLIWPALAAAATFVALIGWHASSFLFFFACLPLVYFTIDKKAAAATAKAAAALVCAAVAAFLVHPALREKAFLASPAVGLAVAVFVTAAVNRVRPLKLWQRLAVLAATFLIYSAGTRPLATPGEYSHIYTMIFYKIRYLGRKPADPAVLPLAAREIWSGPANSPTLAAALSFFGLPFVVAALPVALNVKRWLGGKAAPPLVTSLSYLALFAGLYAIYQRFAVVLIFFTAVAAAAYGEFAKKSKQALVILIPLLALPWEAAKAARYESEPWPWKPLLARAAAEDEGYAKVVGDEDLRLARWFYNQAGHESAAVLAPFADSAFLLTYANTPVVLHPIFEAPGMRAKVRECYEALFADEETFYRVCRKYKVTYVAYHAAFITETSGDSIRYTYGVKRVRADSCAFKMQFTPTTLKHFAPVFQTVSWRVFLVGTPGAEGPDIGPASPLFSPPAATPGGYYDETHSGRVYGKIKRALAAYNAGAEAFNRGDITRARRNFVAAAALCPALVPAWQALARAELAVGDVAAATEAVARAQALDPYDDETATLARAILNR